MFRRGFPIFFAATVGGSIELGAFDKIARSIELHVRFYFRRRDNSAFHEFEDVARLIAANLVSLVIPFILYTEDSMNLIALFVLTDDRV